jgi:glycosyltransferase involved in cell wall biosynthesis
MKPARTPEDDTGQLGRHVPLLVEPCEAPAPVAEDVDLRVAVVLPSYNESLHLPGVIETMPGWVWRIYVVDDCSTDDTRGVVARYVGDRLDYIRHERNQGVGGAVRTGFRRALDDGADVIVKMDADGQMDPDDLEKLVMPIRLGLAEYVKGNRFRVARQSRSMPTYRRIGNVILSLANKVATGYWHVFDPQCGYVAITAPVLSEIDLDSVANDYFFENDMLVGLNIIGARVVDVPVATVYGDEVSHIRLGRVLTSFPVRLVSRWARRMALKHYLWDFGVAGALILFGSIGMLFGSVFGLYHWIMSAISGVAATSGQVMLAVLPLFLGFQMLLQALLLEVQASPGADETREFQRWLMRQEFSKSHPRD